MTQATRRTAQVRKGLCFAFAVLLSSLPGIAHAQNTAKTDITLDQARSLAAQALAHKDHALATQLARGLLKANPEDVGALFALAQARLMAGDPAGARTAAAQAYRLDPNPQVRVLAAELAARAALQEERHSLTQLWLRRAALNVDEDVAKERIAKDYALVRRLNPFSFRINAGLRPSNNVNNGADTALQVIDGVPLVGELSGAAQALEGTIGTLDVNLAYRLRQSERSFTRVSSRAYVRRVWLSSSAKALAPDADNEDFGSSYLDAALTHVFALGAPGNTAQVGARLGRAWSGGDKSYDFGALSASRSVRLGDRMRLSFGATLEDRDDARGDVFDQTRYEFNTSISRALGNGDHIGLSYAITETDADHINFRSTAQSVRATYAFGKTLGPAKVSAALTYGLTNMDDFQVGFIAVPGGREDTSLYGDVTFFFEDYDYGGFAPSVRIRAGQRDSNVSRYDSTEISVNFEIRSTF